MVRKVRAYTEIGKRIAALGQRQHKIARVLGVSQQTISKKLRGECAILLSDLETLSKAYKVPLTYFFEEETDAELSKALDRVRAGSGQLREIVISASQLRPADQKKLLAIAETLGR